MSTPNGIEFTFPVARFVQGDLYKGSDKTMDGKPRTVKTGSNAGQPALQFYMAFAIPKVPGQPWWETEWGKVLVPVGSQAFPQAYNHPSFAWKVVDGDSTVTAKAGRTPPANNEGWPGHWVIKCTSGFAPSVYSKNAQGQPQLDDRVGFINPGDYVQVAAVIKGNGSTESPGIFINHRMVLWQGYGTRILSAGAPDPSKANFDLSGALPAGASATPLAGALPAAMGAGVGGPGMGGVGGPAGGGVGIGGVPGGGMGMVAGAADPGVAVNPNAGILGGTAQAGPGTVMGGGAAVGGLPALGALPALAGPDPTPTPAAAQRGITGAQLADMVRQGHTLQSLQQAGYAI